MHVIATSGHVDHGKSSLIAALTGTHPDRLKEEKEREMTIDLGFGWLSLPDGQEVGIVDVPGHTDFIENMLAGVGGIDAVMLVIAADEGVMPQTREHLAILDLLQIRTGIVIITKIDLIDEAGWIDLVESDIRELLASTILCDAPIVRVSSKTKSGFPNLLQSLSRMLVELPARPDLGQPRLPIDRVFSIAGFGTVITGTLLDGSLQIGEEIELLPSGLQGKIRGLQAHNMKENFAIPGSRTAVNVSGLDIRQIHRGDVLVLPGQFEATKRIDVELRLLPRLEKPLKHHAEAKFFTGTKETIADVRLLGTDKLNPGETCWAQLDLRDPILVVRGDRFILRRPSPSETLGGGRIIDPRPKSRHKQYDSKAIDAITHMAQGSPEDLIIQASISLGFAQIKDVKTRSGLDPESAQTALLESISSGKLIKLEEWVISREKLIMIETEIIQTVENYHRYNPLKLGILREELRTKLKVPPRLFTFILDNLIMQGRVIESTNSKGSNRSTYTSWIALSSHSIKYSPSQQGMIQGLIAKFQKSPYAPPTVMECLDEVGEELFSSLVDSGILLIVSQEVVFRYEDYEKMVDVTRQSLYQREEITLSEVRDLFQTSRRYAQALLEHLDSIGVTVRIGDSRRLKNP